MRFLSCALVIFMVFSCCLCEKKSIESSKQAEERELNKYKANPEKYFQEHKGEFIKGLKDPDPKKRRESISAVRDFKLREAIPQVIYIALNDSDKDVFASTISALALIGDERAIPVMLKGIESSDIWVRRVAAEKLTELHRKEGINTLIEILDSKNNIEIGNALYSLKKFTKKDFGTVGYRQDIPGKPNFIVNPEKMKEVNSKWKKWWLEESNSFTFSEK